MIAKGLRAVYTAVNAETAAEALEELDEVWGNRYPGVIRIWRRAWEEFIPFLRFPPQLRKIVYTTNLVESVHYQLRKVTKTTGTFPHRPIRTETATPRRPEHHQQKRRKPRHRHPRLENSPQPTRNPLPQPTEPNPINQHEPTPSHRQFDCENITGALGSQVWLLVAVS